MRIILSLIVTLAVVVVACGTLTPAPITSGNMCFRCGRPITDVKLAAEIIDTAGAPFKFRTVACLSRYLADHGSATRAIFVTDYPTGKLVRAESATFVWVPINKNTGEKDYMAFVSGAEAATAARQASTTPVDWLAVMTRAGGATTSD